MLPGIETVWDELEDIRRAAVAEVHPEYRKDLGQVLTPVPVARLLVEMFSGWRGDVELVDAGAGAGTLGAAAALGALSSVERPASMRVLAWEVDSELAVRSKETLTLVSERYDEAGIPFEFEVLNEDFLRRAAQRTAGLSSHGATASHAILNPPYAKLSSSSNERALAERLGAPVPNLYAAFMLAASALLKAGGEMVAITPRSFCNGPYFKRFRRVLLSQNGLSSIRVFESRMCAFADQDVLQENAITHLVRGGAQPEMVRVQVGDPGGPVTERAVPSEEVVFPGDRDVVIHVAESEVAAGAAALMHELPATLETIGVDASTGPVVDFRARRWLRAEDRPGSVPLLYPSSVDTRGISWPGSGNKPIAIDDVEETASLLTPRGNYVLVKRFSSKEERRRIVAGPLLADAFPECSRFGIENHVNYLHCQGRPLGRQLAIGLAAFLNHELVDVYFRSFSGHTQVNATDLRRLRIPDRATLEEFGSAPCPHEACHEWIRNYAAAVGVSGKKEVDHVGQTSAVP
ncbi:MAG: Eco57I restriction-modification methylase domain-containing protein [bacterium]|nr:Eco57I restriction-modification methylase domain-containing protein [bacterium]